jgi:hypothetical protein
MYMKSVYFSTFILHISDTDRCKIGVRYIIFRPVDVPAQILNIVPFIGPLHVSLNSRETVFLINYNFFENMYHAIFGLCKILVKKPKPY